MIPCLAVLPAPQRIFWDRHLAGIPRQWVLYGGTAIALRLGHRLSVDFDFFSSSPLDEGILRGALPVLDTGVVLKQVPGTLHLVCPLGGGDLKLSFFGDLRIGRVGDPEAVGNVHIASPLDLLAIKMKVLHDRVEAKDYLDIEALLRSGLDLTTGIRAAQALYGDRLNPLDTAKAVCWFKDGGLMASLPDATRDYLTRAAAGFDPAATPLPLRAATIDP